MATEPTTAGERRIRTATIRICQSCIDLAGEECHTPECVFCFRSVIEAKWLMDKMMIAPIVDGERFILIDEDQPEMSVHNAGNCEVCAARYDYEIAGGTVPTGHARADSHAEPERERNALSGSASTERLGHQEDTSTTKDYDGFRAGMLRAAEMARAEFKRAPGAAKGNDCVWMGGYESACDHLSVAIAQAAVMDSVRVAGAQPDWQYHIALLLPDDAVEDSVLLKIYQVVEHELRIARAALGDSQ